MATLQKSPPHFSARLITGNDTTARRIHACVVRAPNFLGWVGVEGAKQAAE